MRPSAALLVHWQDMDAIAAAAAALPCVLVGQAPPDVAGIGVRCASFDAGDGVLRLLDHLRSLGHRRIAMVSDTASGWRGAERHGAAATAAALRGCGLGQVRLVEGRGWERARRLAAAGTTGWIADSQGTGYALLTHLAGWGWQVPRDASICSFSFTAPDPGRPRLTGMRGDWRAVGRIAARWALTRPDPTDPVTRLLVQSRVLPGETTAPLAAALRRGRPTAAGRCR
jgi:LacI family transcriptional regulator